MTSPELVRVLGKKYSIEILDATENPRSAQEISDELDIPIATCYRRIKELAECDLLELEELELSEGNRRRKVYRRTISDVHISFDDQVSITTGSREVVSNRLDKAWRKLTGSRS